jgi:hypothetical protein
MFNGLFIRVGIFGTVAVVATGWYYTDRAFTYVEVQAGSTMSSASAILSAPSSMSSPGNASGLTIPIATRRAMNWAATHAWLEWQSR